MRRVGRVIAAVASVSILTGCSDHPGPHRTVTGFLIRQAGPVTLGKPRPPAPLPGTVVARNVNVAGEQFTATTGKSGRFQLSLPFGAYRLTGHSPKVMADGQQKLCTAEAIVHVPQRKPPSVIWVY